MDMVTVLLEVVNVMEVDEVWQVFCQDVPIHLSIYCGVLWHHPQTSQSSTRPYSPHHDIRCLLHCRYDALGIMSLVRWSPHMTAETAQQCESALIRKLYALPLVRSPLFALM